MSEEEEAEEDVPAEEEELLYVKMEWNIIQSHLTLNCIVEEELVGPDLSGSGSYHHYATSNSTQHIDTLMVPSLCRNAKTAPSTPEAEQRMLPPPRHAESTSQLEMIRSPRQQQTHSSGGMGAEVLLNKIDPPPKRKKSRNEKFHKLFKTIPAEETVLKCYSCAFFGDILLQGYLYISPNYFCFYSKILGHAKLIQISVQNVLNISREKTAIIIPNAIGILTPKDKYVFGSLMSRDNTFRVLTTLWKQAIPTNGQIPDVNTDSLDPSYDMTDNNNKPSIDITVANTSGDNEEEDEEEEEEDGDTSGTSEDSLCVQCSQPRDSAHVCGSPSSGLPSRSSSPSPRGSSISHGGGGPTRTKASSSTSSMSAMSPPQSHVSPASSPAPATTSSSNGTSQQGTTHVMSQGSSWNVLKLLPQPPQSPVLLTVSSVLVLLLCVSAAVMAYKIVLLQAQLEGAHSPYEGLDGHEVYRDMYYINDQYHTATIRRFHSVLEANIHVLDQVYSSLRSLQRTPHTTQPPTSTPPAAATPPQHQHDET